MILGLSLCKSNKKKLQEYYQRNKPSQLPGYFVKETVLLASNSKDSKEFEDCQQEIRYIIETNPEVLLNPLYRNYAPIEDQSYEMGENTEGFDM